MRFENPSSRFRSTDLLSPQPECETRRLGSRYAHIVAPIELALDDCAAVLLAMEMAALHRARLTVLHVLSLTECEPSAIGLDVLALLHRAVDRIHHRPPVQGELDTVQQTRLQVAAFLERAVPDQLRKAVDFSVECRAGAAAESIASFANKAAADLVIVSTGVSRWWLPILPARVRRLLQLSEQQVILVRPDKPARKGQRPTPSDSARR